MKLGTVLTAAAALGTLFVLFVPRWSHPAPGHQVGYRGQGQVQFDNRERQVALIDRAPAPPPADRWGVTDEALADARPATEAYRNIKVLTGTTAGTFMTLHVAMTQWVSPQQGCVFCHTADMAADDRPQKNAARAMLAMTRTLNADWGAHNGPSGVTCYTCHRGQNVPPGTWYPRQSEPPRPNMARQEDWHEAATTVRDFFPDAGFAEYLLQETPGRGLSYTALPTTGPAAPIVNTRLYEVMMQMSDGVGVNCTYCHNSRAFHDWAQSTPARWTGLAGIHMTQWINTQVLLPLAAAIPQTREIEGAGRLPITPARDAGAQNGNGLATCVTCHYGAPHPLQGGPVAADFPALTGDRK